MVAGFGRAAASLDTARRSRDRFCVLSKSGRDAWWAARRRKKRQTKKQNGDESAAEGQPSQSDPDPAVKMAPSAASSGGARGATQLHSFLVEEPPEGLEVAASAVSSDPGSDEGSDEAPGFF